MLIIKGTLFFGQLFLVVAGTWLDLRNACPTRQKVSPHCGGTVCTVTARALSARGLMKYTLAAKTEHLNANSDYIDEEKGRTKNSNIAKAKDSNDWKHGKVETTDEDGMKNSQKEDDHKVEDFIPHLLSKNPESRTVTKREPILVGPHDDSAEKNKTMMKNPKNLDKKSKNKTMMKNPKNLDKKSESPLLFVDALRPRNDPLWNFR